MKTVAIAALALLVLLSVAACGGSDDTGAGDATGKAFDIRGAVTQITTPEGAGAEGALVVEGEVEDDTKFPKAAVRLSPVTQYLRRDGEGTIPATFEEIKVGTRVEVHFTGSIAGTDPAIAVGGEVIIIE